MCSMIFLVFLVVLVYRISILITLIVFQSSTGVFHLLLQIQSIHPNHHPSTKIANIPLLHRTTIVYHYANMTVEFIFVWSSGRERMKRGKKWQAEKNARKITDSKKREVHIYTFLCHKFRMNERIH
jgi:hypothetical protein